MTAAVATSDFALQPKAGFWIRTIAYIVDAIVLVVVNSILSTLLLDGDITRSSGLNLVVGLAYFLYFWSAYGGGRTLGMRLFKLKVVKTDGTLLSLAGALVRYVGLIVSFVVLLIGVIWVAFDSQKQGWHDKIAGTYVVKVS